MTDRNDDTRNGRASEQVLRELHNALCRHFVKKIDSGEMFSVEEAEVLRLFMRDNGIEVSVAHLIDPMSKLHIPTNINAPFDGDKRHSGQG